MDEKRKVTVEEINMISFLSHTHTRARAQRYAIKLKALYTVNIWYKFDNLNSYLTSH